jgi:hypothetical protein
MVQHFHLWMVDTFIREGILYIYLVVYLFTKGTSFPVISKHHTIKAYERIQTLLQFCNEFLSWISETLNEDVSVLTGGETLLSIHRRPKIEA